MVNLLKKLVSIPSETGDENNAVSFLVDEMKKLGLDAKRDKAGNAIGIAGKGNKKIVLAGHIDTVKGQLPVKASGGFLYGRGSVDAKAALCAFVESSADFLDSSDYQIIVAACVGEESNSGGAHFLKKQIKPNACIIGEPSGVSAITIGYRGRISLIYETKKGVFHTGHANENACDSAINFYNQLKEKFTQKELSFNNSNASLLAINSSSDGIWEKCGAKIDIRTSLDFPYVKFREFLMAQNKNDCKIEVSDELRAVKADKNSFLARAFISAIRSHGLNPSYKVKTGSCDMNIFAKEWNCPILAYGAGDSKLDHTKDERVSLKEYELSKKILATALKNMA